jgi:hypothetical protein
VNYQINIETIKVGEDYMVTFSNDQTDVVDVYRTSSPQKTILAILKEAHIKGRRGRKLGSKVSAADLAAFTPDRDDQGNEIPGT